MAVLQMQKISIYALKENRKAILELLQRRGAVEITDEKPNAKTFMRMDTQSAQLTFEKNAVLAKQALQVLDDYSEEKKSMLSMLNGREPISLQKYEEWTKNSHQIMESASTVVALSRKISENKAEVLRLETQMDALKPWVPLDISMRFKGTKTTVAFIGTFPEERTLDSILEGLAKSVPDISAYHVEIVSASADQTCVFVMGMKKDAEKLESALRSQGFSYPSSPSKTPPKDRIEILQERISKIESKNSAAEEKIKTFMDQREDFQFAVDYYTMRADKYHVLGGIFQSKHIFMITGYLPQKYAKPLEQELSQKFPVVVEIENPSEEEEVPVALQNNGFANPVEPVLESYSLPGRGEVDPCSIMSIFYYIMFGMMLSDAAYGLIMVIACGIILMKFKNLESGMRKTMKMFFFCGVSTVFWGDHVRKLFWRCSRCNFQYFFPYPINNSRSVVCTS